MGPDAEILLGVYVQAAGTQVIPESEDDACTDMTGITPSFANHKC